MSYSIKLFLFLAVATIAVWVAVNQLMAKTDYLPKSFTIDTVKHDEAADKKKKATETLTVPMVTDQRVSKSRVRADEAKRSRAESDADDSTRLTAESERLAEPEGSELIDEEITNTASVDQNEEPIEIGAEIAAEDAEQNSVRSNDGLTNNSSENTRADSDADMQAASDEAADNSGINKSVITRSLPKAPTARTDLKKPPNTVQALDVAYALPTGSDCVIPGDTYPRVGVLYRPASFAIKGRSLTQIDNLIKLYNHCGGGKLLVLENTPVPDEEDASEAEQLMQLRQDEVKYYLLQRRIPKDDMIFPDNS